MTQPERAGRYSFGVCPFALPAGSRTHPSLYAATAFGG